MRTTSIKPWHFTITGAIGRRSSKKDERYTGVVSLDFRENVCFISGLLVQGKPLDRRELKPFLIFAKLMECNEIHYTRKHRNKTRNEVYIL